MPRKTSKSGLLIRSGLLASMRPRPDATENDLPDRGRDDVGKASMRPRPDATENDVPRRRRGGGGRASMRPRPDATENVDSGKKLQHARVGFNEAAARCHGKRRTELVDAGDDAASMRPRPDATENARERANGGAVTTASMRPRPDATENVACASVAAAPLALQ